MELKEILKNFVADVVKARSEILVIIATAKAGTYVGDHLEVWRKYFSLWTNPGAIFQAYYDQVTEWIEERFHEDEPDWWAIPHSSWGANFTSVDSALRRLASLESIGADALVELEAAVSYNDAWEVGEFYRKALISIDKTYSTILSKMDLPPKPVEKKTPEQLKEEFENGRMAGLSVRQFRQLMKQIIG